jgi:hypothetical protein
VSAGGAGECVHLVADPVLPEGHSVTGYDGKPPLAARLAVLLGVLTILIGAPAACLLWMTSVPGRSFTGPLPPLTPDETILAARLQPHVRAIAGEPHNVDHPEALERSARYIENALTGMNYQVRRQRFRAGRTMVRNIEAVIAPAAADAPTLVVGAHYDSCCDAPGANDNATGASAVIELARSLADLNGRASIRVRLVLFVNEEPPFFKSDHMGSLVYARALKRSGEPILGMMSLETLGYYSDGAGSQHYPDPFGWLYPDKGDFIAFVGTVSARAFVRKTVGSFRALA